MKLEIALNEIECFLKTKFNTQVKLKQKDGKQILVDIPYFLLNLSIKEVKKHEVIFYYEAGSLSSKIKVGLVKTFCRSNIVSKIDSSYLQISDELDEIKLDLKQIDQLKEMLNVLSISDLKFENNSVSLGLEVY